MVKLERCSDKFATLDNPSHGLVLTFALATANLLSMQC
jgi:hypothetical protein